jgi:hypothetical protein
MFLAYSQTKYQERESYAIDYTIQVLREIVSKILG